MELPVVLIPVTTAAIEGSSALKVVLFPFSIVLYLSVRVVEDTIPRHFVLGPVTVVIAPISVDVLPFSMPLVLNVFLTFV